MQRRTHAHEPWPTFGDDTERALPCVFLLVFLFLRVQCEASSNVLVRVYEPFGGRSSGVLSMPHPALAGAKFRATSVNLLEQELPAAEKQGAATSSSSGPVAAPASSIAAVHSRPFQIQSIRLDLE